MEELCPDAWLFNYSNPQAIICWAINDYTHIKNIGLSPIRFISPEQYRDTRKYHLVNSIIP